MNFTSGYRFSAPAAPVCGYIPRPNTDASKILNFVLAHPEMNRKKLQESLKHIPNIHSKLLSVVCKLIQYGNQNLVPKGFESWIEKQEEQEETFNNVSVDDLCKIKSFIKSFGAERFQIAYKTLEMLNAA